MSACAEVTLNACTHMQVALEVAETNGSNGYELLLPKAALHTLSPALHTTIHALRSKLGCGRAVGLPIQHKANSTPPTSHSPLPTPHFPLPTSYFLLSTPFSFSTRRKDAFLSLPTSHYPLPAIIAQCSLVHWFLLTRRPIIRLPPPLPRFRTALITCHLLVSSHRFPSALSTHHPRPLTTDI